MLFDVKDTDTVRELKRRIETIGGYAIMAQPRSTVEGHVVGPYLRHGNKVLQDGDSLRTLRYYEGDTPALKMHPPTQGWLWTERFRQQIVGEGEWMEAATKRMREAEGGVINVKVYNVRRASRTSLKSKAASQGCTAKRLYRRRMGTP
jgi:hypothetical protein